MNSIFDYELKNGVWKFFLITVLVFKGVFVSGQGLSVSSGKALAPDLLFERFYSKNGLPDDRIRTIFQDKKGFLWIGTMNGVARYDGYTFKKYYKTRFPNSISGNWAYAICEDGKKNIWIGTREGLNRFDTEKSSFESFVNDKNNPKSISSNVINTLQFDKRGVLWIGTPRGLNRFNPVTKSFKRFNGYPFNTNICSIIASNGDFIWIATRDGAVHYNTKTGQYDFFKIPVKSNPYGDRFWSMIEDHKDLYFATGGNGLIKLPYNSTRNSYDPFHFVNDFKGGSLSNTEVFSICKSLNGDFWLGTTGLGLAKIEKINSPERKITFYRNNALNNQSISNNQVYKVFIDRSNVLWCGTDQGLNKLDLYLLPYHYYTFTDKSKKDQVRSLYSADGKTVWLGTTQSGVVKYNTTSGESNSINFNTKFLNSNRSLLIDGNDVWNGTLDGALKLDKSLAKYKKVVDGHAVFAFLKDSKANVWVGTNNGLYKIKPDGSRVNYLPDVSQNGAIGSGFVRSLYEDHKGNIWIGFENSPIEFFDPKTERFTRLTSTKDFGNIIFSIVEYPENVIWAGSESGLNKITALGNGKYNFKNYSEENGLPDKSIGSILPDDHGNLWLGTIKGLVKFNIQKESFQNYLNNISFNSSSSYKVNDHCFLFGSYEGFVQFDPITIANDVKAPEVVISDLKLSNKSVGIGEEINGDVILSQDISGTKEITLNYDSQFTIEFTALHFSNPASNLYAYKLDGLNDDWIYVNAGNRSATYTNLDAGTYTFMVKASSFSKKWNNQPKTLKIKILPPPWKTWWAILLYLILFNALLFVFVKYILIQSKQRNQILFEQNEKEQLKNLNQMKVRFFTDVSHEFRTPLSLIVGPAEDILNSEITGAVKNKAKLIYRNCTKLLYLLDELMTFQKMEQGMLKLNCVNGDLIDFVTEIYENFKALANKKNVEFNLIAEQQHLFTDFDTRKMEMVMNNLLFNAFKFSKKDGGLINVRISEHTLQDVPENADKRIPNWICIAVEDNGKGISAEEFGNLFQRYFSDDTIMGSGVGLSLTKNLVELHSGVIIAESEQNVKTTFKVYLPHQSVATQNPEDYIYKSEYDISTMVEESVSVNSSTAVSDEEQYCILVVDDNPEVLAYLEMTFSDGYKVAKAENGAEALDYINNNLPDLVISDVMMPIMDGVELCKAVKTDINTCHIPLILLTAKSTIEDRIEGLQIGADDYIPKPFHPNVLKARVENLIKTQKRIIEKFQADGGVIIPKNIAQNPLDEKFLNKVIESIKANMSNDEFSVEELGNMVAMSRSNLFRKLKAITGQTPIEFIYCIRLKHSMELLLKREMSLSDIAYEVGFKNPSSFTKSFKKQFGKSPSEYLNDLLKPIKDDHT